MLSNKVIHLTSILLCFIVVGDSVTTSQTPKTMTKLHATYTLAHPTSVRAYTNTRPPLVRDAPQFIAGSVTARWPIMRILVYTSHRHNLSFFKSLKL